MAVEGSCFTTQDVLQLSIGQAATFRGRHHHQAVLPRVDPLCYSPAQVNTHTSGHVAQTQQHTYQPIHSTPILHRPAYTSGHVTQTHTPGHEPANTSCYSAAQVNIYEAQVDIHTMQHHRHLAVDTIINGCCSHRAQMLALLVAGQSKIPLLSV